MKAHRFPGAGMRELNFVGAKAKPAVRGRSPVLGIAKEWPAGVGKLEANLVMASGVKGDVKKTLRDAIFGDGFYGGIIEDGLFGVSVSGFGGRLGDNTGYICFAVKKDKVG